MRTTLLIYVLLAILGTASPPRLAAAAATPQADDLSTVPRISQAEFKRALTAGTILVLDVRDAESYANGHIPGAVSVPLDELTRHARELKAARRPIVAYCA